jgi:uncharacterized membrane protein YdjX (TVP38/TMEM64 family)
MTLGNFVLSPKLLSLSAKIALLALLVAAFLYLRSSDLFHFTVLQSFGREAPVLAIFAFLVVFVLSSVLLMPTLPLNLLAGAIWGPLIGGLVTACGATVAAFLCLRIGKYLATDLIRSKVEGRIARLIFREVAHNDWIIVAFVRLNPLIPSVVNYAFALSPISVGRYCLFSFIFLLPGTLLIAAAGDVSRDLVLSGRQPEHIIIAAIAIGAAVTLAFGAWVWWRVSVIQRDEMTTGR